MPAHIKSALTQTQLSIPVTDGRFAARHLAGVPISCVSRADPPGFRIRRAADFSEPPLRYVVVWNVAKDLSHFAGEVVIGTASRLRWEQEFESPFLQRRVSNEPGSPILRPKRCCALLPPLLPMLRPLAQYRRARPAAAMTIRNATTGLNGTNAPMTVPTAPVRALLIGGSRLRLDRR
jgi:hypothetical protein